jgi:hypothetical protein
MYWPVSGRENVKRVMEAASKIYESLQFTDQAVDGRRQYLEWKARAFGDIGMSGVTVITRNEAGAIAHLAIHHRPLGGALRFPRRWVSSCKAMLRISWRQRICRVRPGVDSNHTPGDRMPNRYSRTGFRRVTYPHSKL